MKIFNKLFVFVLIVITLFSTLLINAFAENIDYNRSFAINKDGVYEFYSYSSLGAFPLWSTYIDYVQSYDNEIHFSKLSNFVIYGNNYLIDKGNELALLDVSIKASAGGGIYQLKPLYTVDANTVTFDSHIFGFESPITYGEFKNALCIMDNQNDVIISGYYGNLHTYFKKGTIYRDEALTESLKEDDVIIGGVTYYFSLNDCVLGDRHDGIPIEEIKRTTCIEEGHYKYQCILCHEIYDVIVPIDLEYGHDYVRTTILEPTHFNEGLENVTCKYCSFSHEVVIPVTEHKYSQPTCTEPSYCVIEGCGMVNNAPALSKPLGHKFTEATCYQPGVCQRTGCNETTELLPHTYKTTICEGTYCTVCAYYLEEPIGHLMNFKGECTRENCGYYNSRYVCNHEFNWLNICKHCGVNIKNAELPVCEGYHDFNIVGTCTVCGIKKGDVNSSGCPGHEFNFLNNCKNCGINIKDANITKCEGYHDFNIVGTCTVCGIKKRDVNSSDCPGHEFDFLNNCKNCGINIKNVELPKCEDGHKYNVLGTCTVCGTTYDEEKSDNGEVSFSDVWRILLIVLCVLPIVLLVYVIIRLVIKVKNALNKDSKKKVRK